MLDWLKNLIGGGSGGEFRRLVRLAGGDSARAERLVDYEKKRDPSLSRAEAVRSAIARLEYDRTR